MDPYITCPTVETERFTLRLIQISDAEGLFECYHDRDAVRFMNEDHCDFGFYTESIEQMKTTLGYWLDFYKQRFFIRFAIVDRETGKAVGTVEGFCDDIGVLRVDIARAYEKRVALSQLLQFAEEHFYEYFGNKILVTKAIPEATERRAALEEQGWEAIGSFRGYSDYFQKKLCL